MRRAVLAGMLLLCADLVAARTFYIDSFEGRDHWSGTLPDAGSDDGPWQTLSRVGGRDGPQAGDRVLLRCGGLWREQLVIPVSGRAGEPVTFASYGDCASAGRPRLSGALPVSGWRVAADGMFSAVLALPPATAAPFINGDFDVDLSGWKAVRNQDRPISIERPVDCNDSGGCLRVTTPVPGSHVASVDFELPRGEWRVGFRLRAGGIRRSIHFRVVSDGVALVDEHLSAGDAWDSYDFKFSVPVTSDRTRLYFRDGSRSGAGGFLDIDAVRLSRLDAEPGAVRQLFAGERLLDLARHPNPRADATADSYLPVQSDSSDCPRTNGPGIASFVAGGLAGLGEQDLLGAGVHIRINEYMIEDRTVTGYEAGTSRVLLDRATSYNFCSDWGYYLDNRPWMLDRPGEWYFDAAGGELYVRLADDAVPGSTIVAAVYERGIDARGRAHIVIDGLALEKFDTGIDIAGARDVTVRHTVVKDAGGTGIRLDGANTVLLEHNTVENTVRSGIRAGKVAGAGDIRVLHNRVIHAGLAGPPRRSYGAIELLYTDGAVVEHNHVSGSGYSGISVGMHGRVTDNVVEDTCRVLDDCGALYTNGVEASQRQRGNTRPQHTQFTGNIVLRAHGNPYGKPAGLAPTPGARGVYLDGDSNSVTVTDNVIVNTSHGISVNGVDNRVTGNTVFGVNEEPVRITREGAGQVTRGNLLDNNILFTHQVQRDPDGHRAIRGRHDHAFMEDRAASLVIPEATYSLQDIDGQGSSVDFADFRGNRLSVLYSDTIANDRFGNRWLSHGLAAWQRAGKDTDATVFDNFAIARYRIAGRSNQNLVRNPEFGDGVRGWNGSGGRVSAAACVTGTCMIYEQDRTARTGSAGSGPFRLRTGNTYLVGFDLRGGRAGQKVDVVVRGRRPGGQVGGVGLILGIMATPKWQSHAHVFRAAGVDGEAWLDFTTYNGGDLLNIDNVRIEQVTLEFNDPDDDAEILVNPGPTSAAVECPPEAVAGKRCGAGDYIRFIDGSSVVWPLQVPAGAAEIIVRAHDPFRDTDRDGVVDSQDDCAATPPATPVSVTGCSFAQTHTQS